MNKIEIGDFVIVNEMDRPCLKLVAQVIGKKDEDNLICRYLFINYEVQAYPIGRMTKVSTFGIFISFQAVFHTNKTIAYSDKIGVSMAQYPNGLNREWQPDSIESTKGYELQVDLKTV